MKKILTDQSGIYYTLVDIGNDNMRLESTKFPYSGQIYKKSFIEGAIKTGHLIDVPKHIELSTKKP